MKATRISKLIGIPLRTVYDWIQKVEDDVDILEHHTNNFSQGIDDDTRMDIINDVIEAPRQASTRRLGARYDVSHTAVRDVLLNEGLEFRKPQKKHTLTKDEMEDRVFYCKDMLKYKASKIKSCFFSDEMGIRLTELYKPRKLWLLPYEEPDVVRIDVDVKINCWGAISWNGATSLHIFSQNLKNPLYQSIVNTHKMEMENLYPQRDFSYQQDNHPTHNKLDVFNNNENIEIIQFPTYSPDLNPIENVWATLKYRVARDAPMSEQELVQSLQYNWQQITILENLRPYIKILESRYRECIEKNGQRLPY
jgi:transposase